MAQQYAYNYARIDESGWCYEVCTTTRNCDDLDGYIPIAEYNDAYMLKYYNRETGLWYEDAAFTIEWTP